MKSETRWKFNGILRTMVVALILTMVLPFWGQGNSGYSFAGDSVGYKLVFIDSQTGRTIATKEGSAKPGDKIGPDQEIQVRDTYYDKSSGTDYDLDTSAENSPMETRISSDKDKNVFTYHYTKHAQRAVEITFNCVTKDNMKVLKSESKKVSPEKKAEYTAPETIKENGKIYKAAGQPEKDKRRL